MRRLLIFFSLTLLLFTSTILHANGGGSISYGDTVEGDLTPNEEDTWTFRGEAAQRVVISAERFPHNPTSTLNPYLELYDPSGELIASDEDRGVGLDALLLGIELPEDGLYSIKVRSESAAWAEGGYQLAIAADTLPVECETLEGEIITGEFQSEIARTVLTYRVYLPPCHENIRYPYIILLHGSASSDSHWDRIGMDDAVMRGVALGRIPPVVLAMPFGGEYGNLNIFQEGDSYEYIILDEFMPLIEETYCVMKEPEGRAIGGISRGGFWAYMIGMRNPELFISVGGHSPFFDLYHAPDTHNPLALALSVNGETMPRLWMDRGKFDYAQYYIDIMRERLVENNVLHTFHLYDTGEHREDYWTAHVDDYLAFYTEPWAEMDALPACDETE